MAPTYFVGFPGSCPTAFAARTLLTMVVVTSSQPIDEKAHLRDILRRRRAETTPEAAQAAARKIAAVAFAHVAACLAPGAKIALYAALPGELDPSILLERLAAAGFITLLPVAGLRATPLAFRSWRPGEKLVLGRFGLREPAEGPELRPDLVFAPLLGFDDFGARLGFGGGFYDATLEKLRAQGPVMAGGLAFACQRVARLAVEPHDQKLDFLVTEQGFLGF